MHPFIVLGFWLVGDFCRVHNTYFSKVLSYFACSQSYKCQILSSSISDERERQQTLARERLEARRRKKTQGQLTDEALTEKLTKDEEKVAMEDAVREMEGLYRIVES